MCVGPVRDHCILRPSLGRAWRGGSATWSLIMDWVVRPFALILVTALVIPGMAACADGGGLAGLVERETQVLST